MFLHFHDIASTRSPGFTEEPYLSAQVNTSTSLPVHKDKNKHSFTSLIAFGNFTGGRLWIESPIGTHPPPNPRNAAERKLRGEYHNTHKTWMCFDPQLYHALEEVTSGNRVSIALFTPKGWNKLTHNCMDDSLTLGCTHLTQLFLLMLVQLYPLQLLHPTPFTLLHTQLLLVQLQLLL